MARVEPISAPLPVDGAGRAAVVLLSGGLDSAVTLAWMRAAGFRCAALSFDYGQRHRVELECAARVASALGAVEHRVVPVDLRAFGGSALTADIEVPKDRDVSSAHDIPVTYVPARNTIFLSMALGLAEVLGARDLAIGVNALDYSGYPDCRPEFVQAFERLANLATKAGVEASASGERGIRIHSPLLRLSKTDIIRLGSRLGVDFGHTSSCYDPRDDGAPCGHCDSCQLRARGFAEAGLRDARAG
jgi:7-cyano-7-deazaguanine synthase